MLTLSKENASERGVPVDDSTIRELENLREENQILRDSLTEYRDEEEPMEKSKTCPFKRIGMGIMLSCQWGLKETKVRLEPGAEKLSSAIKVQMGKNPVPFLIAAFGIGFLLSRRFFRKG